MAFFITNNGDTNTILTDGGSVKVGLNLEVVDGYLNASGGGGGEPQVQADWNQTDDTKVDYIKNKPVIPSGGGSLDNVEVNSKRGTVSTISGEKISEVLIEGGDILLTGYEEATGTNDNLNIQQEDTVNEGFGKMLKALKDDEAVHQVAFSSIRDSTGFTDELKYLQTSDTTSLLYNVTNLQQADTKIAEATRLLEIKSQKTNKFTVSQGNVLVTYTPHYSGDTAENKSIKLYGSDFINLTKEFPPATTIDPLPGEDADYYVLDTALRTIVDKTRGTAPMEPGSCYTWEERTAGWVLYLYIGPDNSSENFKNSSNWVKRW